MIQLKRKSQLSFIVNRGPHTIISDVSKELGGNDEGLNPHELLEAALAACTASTLQMYANRKQWPLEGADVEVKFVSEGTETIISRQIKLNGPLDEEQRARLLDIANKCPIHKVLSQKITII